MQRLKGVFASDLSEGPLCGAPTRVIAEITDPKVVAQILEHIAARAPAGHRHAVAQLEQAIPDGLADELGHAGRLEGVSVEVGNLVGYGRGVHGREGSTESAGWAAG
jgi:hypothetical protein